MKLPTPVDPLAPSAPRSPANSTDSAYPWLKSGSFGCTSDSLSKSTHAHWMRKTLHALRPAGLAGMLQRLHPKREVKRLQAMNLHTEGSTYAMGGSEAHGYFGVFRSATDAQSRRLGVKQLYWHDDSESQAMEVPSDPRVHSQQRSAIVKELAVQSQAAALKPIEVIESEADQQIFIVMPLMQGDLLDVANHLDEKERAPVTWSIFAQVAANVALCHQYNLAHRDLKLDNILWDERGTVVLSDYGLADTLREDGTLEDLRGTAFHLPPEALANQPYTNKLDMWLFGLTMLRALAPHEQPFRAGFEYDVTLAKNSTAHHKRQLAFAKSRVEEFVIWRKQYLAGEASASNPFTASMAVARAANPELFDIVVGRVLDDNPLTRADSDEILDVALAKLHSMSEPDKLTARRAFARLAKKGHARREAIFASLRAFLHLSRTEEASRHPSDSAL